MSIRPWIDPHRITLFLPTGLTFLQRLFDRLLDGFTILVTTERTATALESEGLRFDFGETDRTLEHLPVRELIVDELLPFRDRLDVNHFLGDFLIGRVLLGALQQRFR